MQALHRVIVHHVHKDRKEEAHGHARSFLANPSPEHLHNTHGHHFIDKSYDKFVPGSLRSVPAGPNVTLIHGTLKGD
jgi:hypothetical protein